MKKHDTNKDTRIAFLIWTPFHLFNAVRYILSRHLNGKCDAFYICQSEGMKKYYQEVQQEGIFKNLYYTTSERIKKHKHLWEISCGLFLPTIYVRHMFGRGSVGNAYDQIFMSVPTRLNDAVVRANHCDEVIGYDDGTGSYIWNLYSRSLGRKYEIVRNLISRNKYTVNKEYLNNLEYKCRGNDGTKQYRLVSRELDEEEKQTINRIFAYDDNKHASNYIYLNQPVSELMDDALYLSEEIVILESLYKIVGEETIVRMHPREHNTAPYTKFSMMDNTNLWELVCNEEIDNSNTLISFFSTAQFTPKILYNKEPNLVFLFNLFQGLSNDVKDKYEKLIEKLEEAYSDKEKILVPKTICEFDSIMSTISKHREN